MSGLSVADEMALDALSPEVRMLVERVVAAKVEGAIDRIAGDVTDNLESAIRLAVRREVARDM